MKSITSKITLAVLAVVLIAGAAFMLGTGVKLVPNTVSAASVPYSSNTVTAIYQNASPAVVEIQVTQQSAGYFGRAIQEGQGSGFLIDKQGHILTNNHVVSGAASVKVEINPGSVVDATVVGTDPADDLALIKVDASTVSGITPLQLGDSNAVQPGQMAIALGNPFGLIDSITLGVISGLNRNSGSERGMIQTDASINPGNSGGPLIDEQGMVIGINTSIEPANGASGVGFAVPSNIAKNALPDLLAGRRITRPWLGISGSALTSPLVQSLGISTNQGVYVATVVPGSPAEKAGLKGGGNNNNGASAVGGDVIVSIDGKSIASVDDLSSYINTKKVGDVVNLAVLRNASSSSVRVTLEAWPDRTSTGETPQQPQPQPRYP